MATRFDWGEFLRITSGVFFIGLGITIVGNSAGNTTRLILGFLSIGVGIAIVVNKR